MGINFLRGDVDGRKSSLMSVRRDGDGWEKKILPAGTGMGIHPPTWNFR